MDGENTNVIRRYQGEPKTNAVRPTIHGEGAFVDGDGWECPDLRSKTPQ